MAAPGNKNATSSPWWMLILRPRNEMRRLVQSEGGLGFIVLNIFSGFAAVYFFADIFNLSDKAMVGQVMSFTLIFGPVIGIFLGLLLPFSLMAASNLFDKNKPDEFQRKERSMTGFFLFLFVLLWFLSFLPLPGKVPMRWTGIILLLGGLATATMQEKIWTFPGLRAVRKGWSTVADYFSWLYGFVSGGKVSFFQIYRSSGWAAVNILFVSVIFILELRFHEGGHFSSSFDPALAGYSIGFLYFLRALSLFFFFCNRLFVLAMGS
jgi:hypothetical protein